MAILTPDDVRPYLNKTSAADDGKLDQFISAAEAMLAARCGPLEPTPASSVVRGSGTTSLPLPIVPIISVATVTARSGLTISPAWVDTEAGVIHGDAAFTEDFYTVVYQAGRECPSDLRQGILELVRHLWITQRGAGDRTGSPMDDVMGGSYSLPRRVEQLIAPYLQPGFA